MAWYGTWKYRNPFTLSRPSGSVTNYQLPLKVYYGSGTNGTETLAGISAGKFYCNSECQADFDDIRITSGNGASVLHYWLEGKTDSNNAVLWVEFDYIGTSATTFYIYYGNDSASSVSSGSETFIDYEDFENATTWYDNWTTIGSPTILRHATAKHGSASMYIVDDQPTNAGTKLVFSCGPVSHLRTLYWVRMATITERCYLGYTSNGTYGPLFTASNDSHWEYYNGSAFVEVGNYSVNQFYKIRSDINCNTDKFTVYVDDVLTCNNVDFSGGVTTINDFRTYGLSTHEPIWWIDTYCVMQYLATEPAWGTWGSRQRGGPLPLHFKI